MVNYFSQQAQSVLREILEKSPRPSVVIFDLDSTLYDVSHRTKEILSDFIASMESSTSIDPLIPLSDLTALKQISVTSVDWGIREPMINSKFPFSRQTQILLRDFWKSHFFSGQYLKYDRLYDGATKYVKDISASGIEIRYLTGRDKENMGTGTLSILAEHELPLLDAKHLVMKPTKGLLEDDVYKAIEITIIAKQFQSVWFFENEPFIIQRVEKECPTVKIVFIDSTHSRRAEPPVHLPKIGK